MHKFSLSYAKAVNKRYDRIGHLFQGHFKAVQIEENEYLIHLSRYLHLNPVAVKMVKAPEGWQFSSYRVFAGFRNGTLISPDIVLSQFESKADYQRFVREYQARDLEIIEHLILE